MLQIFISILDEKLSMSYIHGSGEIKIFEKLGRKFLYSEYFMHACTLEINYKTLKIKSFSTCRRKMVLLIFPLVFAVSPLRLFHHAFYDSFLN